MSNEMLEFRSLSQARYRRDRLAVWASEEFDAERVERWCRGEPGYEQQIDALKVKLQQNFIGGVPGWPYLDELKAAIHYIVKAERDAVHQNKL